jgi:hypothetical protein
MYLARVFPDLAIDRRGNRIALDQDKVQRDQVSLGLSSLYVYGLWTSGRVQCTYMYLEICIEMAPRD